MVNEHRYGALLEGLSENASHSFAGEHALGGLRRDKKTIKRWFERLGKVLPNIQLTVKEVYVVGLPHNTTAIALWDAKATLENGDMYTNRGVHIVKIRWGKIFSLDVHEDSQTVAEALKIQGAAGIEEAVANKIES